jgi:alkylation response protein AidB-like acyl-CoA dehydrogenase
MDLELTDEQAWLVESIDTLLERTWPPVEAVDSATDEHRRRVWQRLIEFGALTIGHGEGLGAIESCLIARALGSRLTSVPFLGSAAVRLALAPLTDFAETLSDEAAVAIGLLEPTSSWCIERPATRAREGGGRITLCGEKVAIEHLEMAERLAVVALLDQRPGLVLLPTHAPGVLVEPRPSFDRAIPMFAARFSGVRVAPATTVAGPAGQAALDRLLAVGALLAAAEAIGSANAILDLATRYAAERRQFGRPIGSFQSVRHLLADMYVRQTTGWSTVLYGAAAFDGGADDAAQTAAIAKAYVSRAAREVAHGAMQVFGGIAFTAEHPAHRFLRRIIVREQQFGDGAHHERALGRALASRVSPRPPALAEASLP